MGRNVTQLKGDSIQVESRLNNLKKCVVTPTFYVIKWKWRTYSACTVISFWLHVSKSYLGPDYMSQAGPVSWAVSVCRDNFQPGIT